MANNKSIKSNTSMSSSLSLEEGRVAKPVVRRRTRASRRTPVTLFNTDTSNFRAMVQQFTGGGGGGGRPNNSTFDSSSNNLITGFVFGGPRYHGTPVSQRQFMLSSNTQLPNIGAFVGDQSLGGQGVSTQSDYNNMGLIADGSVMGGVPGFSQGHEAHDHQIAYSSSRIGNTNENSFMLLRN